MWLCCFCFLLFINNSFILLFSEQIMEIYLLPCGSRKLSRSPRAAFVIDKGLFHVALGPQGEVTASAQAIRRWMWIIIRVWWLLWLNMIAALPGFVGRILSFWVKHLRGGDPDVVGQLPSTCWCLCLCIRVAVQFWLRLFFAMGSCYRDSQLIKVPRTNDFLNAQVASIPSPPKGQDIRKRRWKECESWGGGGCCGVPSRPSRSWLTVGVITCTGPA